MDTLVVVIQRLHEALSALGDASIRLPAIVAVGGQSSGKSSVLESIVGRDFLPRGTGIVTRRPVMMYLHNVPRIPSEAVPDNMPGAAGANVDMSEWVEFAHLAGRRVYNFDEAKMEIVKEMERVAGRNKGISAEPICLTIHSPRVPDLVIVDLPGITKVPVGEQPADIENQVRRLCLHYMSQQNNIILAVHPANQDLANSDALKLAMEADPEGERTIGVLTKIDLMDPGTDARDVLSGRVVALRRGFVPIVCRSQKDIQEGMPIVDGLTREKAFFERHYAYRAMASRCGTPYLTRMLSHMLFTAIKAHLPSIRSQLSLAAQSYEQQLRELGDPVEAAGPREQGHLLLKLLSRFASNFCDMIEGRVHADAGSDMLIDELFGGARMSEIVRTRFNQWTAEWEQLMDSQLRDDEILMAVRNSAGPRNALFIPEQAFISLVRRQIVQLKDLGRRFADEIYDELRRIAEKCEPPQLYRFGELREKAVEVVQNLLRRAFLPTVDMIDRLIDIELSHINTTHPDFIGAAKALEYVLLEDRQHASQLGQQYEHGAGHEDGGENPASDEGGELEIELQSPGMHRRQYSRVNGRAGTAAGSSTTADDANGGSSNGDDVSWAIKRLGAQNNQVGGGVGIGGAAGDAGAGAGFLAGLRGVFGGRQAGAGAAAAGSQQTQDDIRARFGPRVVHEMLGDDNNVLLLGAVKRVGGPNSPFVELPRPSPLTKAGGAGLGAANGPSGLIPSSPGGQQQQIQFGGGNRFNGGDRWASPGSVNGVAALPSNAAAAANNAAGNLAATMGAGGAAAGYQGMSLLVVPQKPLPEVITPSDLRPDDKEKREIKVIRVLLQSYLAIVKKNYTDIVPKTVMCMLVNRVKDEIASELVHHLYASITSVDALLRETDDVASRRRELVEQTSILNRGISILNEIRDSGIIAAPPHSSITTALQQVAAAAAAPGQGAAQQALYSQQQQQQQYSGGYNHQQQPVGSGSAPSSPVQHISNAPPQQHQYGYAHHSQPQQQQHIGQPSTYAHPIPVPAAAMQQQQQQSNYYNGPVLTYSGAAGASAASPGSASVGGESVVSVGMGAGRMPARPPSQPQIMPEAALPTLNGPRHIAAV